jgi:hypothetical protein
VLLIRIKGIPPDYVPALRGGIHQDCDPAGITDVIRNATGGFATKLMMPQQSCFHFLFASAIKSTGSAFMTPANKKCPWGAS